MDRLTPSDDAVWHRSYGPALPTHNWVPAPRYLLRRARVLHHIAAIAPCRVVDIGCGPAALLAELAAKGFDAVGVDRAQPALDLAARLAGPGSPMRLQAELDPDWRGSFDLAMSFEVIEHLEEDVQAMAEWREYLRPGGRMILSTPAHPSRWNAADVWAGHVRRYTRTGLTEAITSAGFTIEKFECYGFPLANVMEVLRARAYGKALEQAAKSDKSADDLTDESGSDRSVESRFWKLFASRPMAAAMGLAAQLQRPFLQTDLGNGYLVVARKT
ncbi:putative S-adenosylmethionine-dependent methyltransferase (plasmid) [Sulfitobacter sp. THAF37]|nr:putative S-adenosylmethionine-dependent methyltransferase [Sulfitobacter sp. THAF37]